MKTPRVELDVHTSEARPGLINSAPSGCFAKPLSGASISQVDAAPSPAAGPFITLCIFQFNCAEERKKKKSDACPCACSAALPPDESVLLFSEVHHGET